MLDPAKLTISINHLQSHFTVLLEVAEEGYSPSSSLYGHEAGHIVISLNLLGVGKGVYLDKHS